MCWTESYFASKYDSTTVFDCAPLEAAVQEGMEKGREEGLLAGKVQTLQELLGEPMSSNGA